MGLMEPGCNLEDFGRPVQPAATNRLRCRVNVVSERYLVERGLGVVCVVVVFGLCMVSIVFVLFFLSICEIFLFVVHLQLKVGLDGWVLVFGCVLGCLLVVAVVTSSAGKFS
jgi:hypothetical protein